MTNHNILELLEATLGANQDKVPAPTDGSITSFLFPTRADFDASYVNVANVAARERQRSSPLAAHPTPGVSRSSDEGGDQAIPVTPNAQSRGDSSYSLPDSCRSAIRPFEAFASCAGVCLTTPYGHSKGSQPYESLPLLTARR